MCGVNWIPVRVPPSTFCVVQIGLLTQTIANFKICLCASFFTRRVSTPACLHGNVQGGTVSPPLIGLMKRLQAIYEGCRVSLFLNMPEIGPDKSIPFVHDSARSSPTVFVW